MGSRVKLLLGFIAGFCLMGGLEAQLRVGFYRDTCTFAELIVKNEVRKAVISSGIGITADLVRLHFHDCFVRGCDGSVLIDSTPSNTAEKDSPVNLSLEGFDLIDNIKARLERQCKGVVSCADIVAFAARDSFELTGGYSYDVPAGRRDGRISLASEAQTEMPAPTFNLDQLTESFARKDLTQQEMVTLSGAHSIGEAHCNAFSNRLYNFSGTGRQDPTLDATYAELLKQRCHGEGSEDPNLEVPMDPASPDFMDTSYYRGILLNRGLFTSDQTLMTTAATANQVRESAMNVFVWRMAFAAAMVKMGKTGVLTGTQGEIRTNCSKIN